MARGSVFRDKQAKGTRWCFVLELGEQPCVRCVGTCAPNARTGRGPRHWSEGTRSIEKCPECGGPVVPGKERRQVWGKGSFPTKGAADKAMRQALTRLDAGRDAFPSSVTITELAKRWLDHKRASGRVRPVAMMRYEQLLNLYLLNQFGTFTIGEVRPGHVQAALDLMTANGLSPATVRHARNVANGMFKYATRLGLIETNPASPTEAPMLKPYEYAVLAPEDLMRIVRAASGTRWEIAVWLCCTLGLRRSEALGVQWDAVDFENAELLVRQSAQRIDKEVVFTPVKTTRSRRAVPIPVVTLERLRKWKIEQAERRLAFGAEWVDLNLVAERGDGSFLNPWGLSQYFKDVCRKLGLPTKARLHDARHGVATALAIATEGDAVAVRDALGHAQTSFTLNTYIHPTAATAAKTRAALDATFGVADER